MPTWPNPRPPSASEEATAGAPSSQSPDQSDGSQASSGAWSRKALSASIGDSLARKSAMVSRSMRCSSLRIIIFAFLLGESETAARDNVELYFRRPAGNRMRFVVGPIADHTFLLDRVSACHGEAIRAQYFQH